MWKPVLTALALPPVPWMLLLTWATWRWSRARVSGPLLFALGLLLWWLSACEGTAIFLQDRVLRVPPPLSQADRDALRQRGRAQGAARPAGQPLAVVVLGGGLEPVADEYGAASLSWLSMSRLRYGVWLSKELRAPLGMSGGVGWAQKGLADGAGEAEVGARIAKQEWGVSLRWVESGSADTRGNAQATVAMLAADGVREVVLVSSAYHLPRARRVFEEAAQQWAVTHPGTPPLTVVLAGTGYWRHDSRAVLEWLPSAQGMALVHTALREWLGQLVRA